jgi:hypothetical protein
MRVQIALAASFVLSVGVFAATSFGQLASPYDGDASAATEARRDGPQFTFILFWKQQDASTQQFAELLRSAVVKHAERASWTSVHVRDPANRAVVEQYDVSRAPMPLVLCVADNGAVTSVFTRRPTEAALERALVTPAMAEVTKALQDKKIVVVHVTHTRQTELPAGAAEFAADADFQARTNIVNVALDDPQEARFLADMQISGADVNGSTLVIMAPPAALVGKFPGSTTRDQIIQKLHAAGKCCDNPNCTHNQPSK